jgi:8-oxo-dGTP pyrophosphatase MutT (NUDIX family)
MKFTAIAILYQDNQFLMQLRDNISTINSPGCWEIFGGHIEPGETPETAIQREILEEIHYKLPSVSKFGVYPHEKLTEYVFYAPLLLKIDQLQLNEGWDMGFLTPEDIYQGGCYSAVAREVRPLSANHQQIMLDFITASIHTQNSVYE